MDGFERWISIVLSFYNDKDFIDKKRAHFLFYFLAIALVVSFILLVTTPYLQIKNPEYVELYIPVLLPILGAFVAFAISLLLLIKGKFTLSANLLIVSSLTTVWLVVFFDNASILNKINTLFFILAAITVFPLLIGRKSLIIRYGIANLGLFVVFIFHLYLKSNHNIFLFELKDTILDFTFAISFSTIVLYYTSRINYLALIRAREEIEERKKIGLELQHHKDNLENLVKEKTIQLEAYNEDLQAANDQLFEKNELINAKNEELNKAMKNLKETQAQLLQSEKMISLGILTAGISHELNNPLNYIMGAYVGLESYFEKNGSKDEKTTRLLLDSIKAGIDKSSNIIKGLNQFSRDNSRFNEDCDIHTIIDNCLLMLHNQSKHKVKISKNFCNDSLIVKGNIGKLHQVFINIIANSIYSIIEKGEIQIVTEQDEQNVTVEISDNGTGIKEEDLSRITDPFFSTKPPGEGTGLGLSITYSIIKDHGGIIEFESEFGKGTKAIIKIPS